LTKQNHPLRVVPLGGLGEVGKNMMIYEYHDELIIVDTGIMFPENDMLGIDYIIPDMQYLKDNPHKKVLGIIYTHGHEDHIGAVKHVLDVAPAPIYATQLTRGLLEAKLGRNGSTVRADIHTVKAGEQIALGSFMVDFFHVCHSVPDGIGLGIHTPQGLIVHTGDFKFDQTPVDNWPTDFSRLAELSQQGVLALMADSTNAERPGWTPSEKVINDALDDIFREAEGRIIVASFASLISRMQQVANMAAKYGRKIAFVGTSMVDNAKISRKLGYLNIDDSQFVGLDQALRMPPSQVVMMCTGSQGEPASILGRLADGRHAQIDIQVGDTVILSSHPIPGNEEVVFRTINRLIRRGAHVLYESIAPVHVSGHASAEELKLMLNLVRPQFYVPIHGELRHLMQNARLARQVGIDEENILVVENGQVIEFQNGYMRKAERVPGSYVFLEGNVLGGIGMDAMQEREKLSQAGIIIVNIDFDTLAGGLRGEPDIHSYGFYLSPESTLKQAIANAIPRANGNLKETLVKAIRAQVYEETLRRPLIDVNIHRS
jgi:ribonuclease J